MTLRFFEIIHNNLGRIYKAALFLLAVLVIVQLFPRLPRFGYDYQQGRPWTYADLIASFDFAIMKSPSELDVEKEMVLKEFKPFFALDSDVADGSIQAFVSGYNSVMDSLVNAGIARRKAENYLYTGINILDTLYKRGIIFLPEDLLEMPPDFEIRLIDGQVAQTRKLQDFFSVQQAYGYISQIFEDTELIHKEQLRRAVENAIAHNVYHEAEISEMALQTDLNNIALTRGMVQDGEKIISKGELISEEKYQLLESYRAEYHRITGRTANLYLLYAGQVLLVGISMVVLFLFLYVFRRDIYENNRSIMLILLVILLMITFTGLVIRYSDSFLYMLPVCIVPVVIRAFFDNRLALYVHINTIILIGFFIPRSFDFVFMQFIAGIIAILSMVSLRRRSQLFFTVILIFITYAAVYLGLSLAHGGSFRDLLLTDYLFFAAGALLTLFAYPLIFLFERLFGLPTDFSLLELADTNNELLRQLSMEAPGTFQHSLQVANLAEEAIFEIGGNALLTRTGALYHDIGKMHSPMYFTENQISGYNPHEELSNKESAEIIINHVLKGVEMARKKNLPEYIIDFIRTHHGSTTARYFYTMHLRENTDNEADKSDFSYPGPKPFSRETAIVMMADSVEAASKSLVKPDAEKINSLVDQIITTQAEERQFENSPITFKDVETAKRIFKQRLMNIYHIRISYPSAS